MIRKLLFPLLATAVLAGCVTDYSLRGGSGGGSYYYGRPSVDYRYYGAPYGYGYGYPYGYGGSYYRYGGYYGNPYRYGGYGYPYGYYPSPYPRHYYPNRPHRPPTTRPSLPDQPRGIPWRDARSDRGQRWNGPGPGSMPQPNSVPRPSMPQPSSPPSSGRRGVPWREVQR